MRASLPRFVLGLLAFGVACAGSDGPTGAPSGGLAPCTAKGLMSPGEVLPDCSFERFDGGAPLRLASTRGKPLVLNFWASWCVYCIKEMPDFQRVYADLAGRVEIVGMDLLGIQAETRIEARRFAERTGVRYPLAFDEGGKLFAHFNARVLRPPLPLTVFVDAGGAVAERHFGPLKDDQLRARLRALFGID